MSSATLYAVVNTSEGGNSGTTVYQGTRPWEISTSSLPTISIGNTLNALVTVINSQATLTIGSMLPTGSNFIGLATVTNANQPALVASSAFIGLVSTASIHGTFQQTYPSTPTSFATVISTSGNSTIFQPPSGQRWIVQDLLLGSQGKTIVSILSGTNTVLPLIGLATLSGYVLSSIRGVRSKANDQSFVVNLDSAATVSVFANVIFE